MLYQGRDWRGQVTLSNRPDTLGTCIFETIKDGQPKKMVYNKTFFIIRSGILNYSSASPVVLRSTQWLNEI